MMNISVWKKYFVTWYYFNFFHQIWNMFSFFHFMCLYWAFNIHRLGYPAQLCLTTQVTWHLSHRSQGWRIHQTARRGKSRIRSSFFRANMKHDIGHTKIIQNITLFKQRLLKQDHARYLDKLAWILLICIRYRACSFSNVILIFSGLLTEKSVIIPQINTQKFCSALHLVEGQTKMHVQKNWPREARLFLTCSNRAVWVCGELLWDRSCDTSVKAAGRPLGLEGAGKQWGLKPPDQFWKQYLEHPKYISFGLRLNTWKYLCYTVGELR